MKKALLSFALLFCFYVIGSAQITYEDPIYGYGNARHRGSSNYVPHLVEHRNSFDIGLGAGFSYDEDAFSFSLRGGYYFTDRLSLCADLLIVYDESFLQLLPTLSYTYEAIPSIRGGFYFDIGLAAGVDSYNLINSERKARFYPFLGPSLSVKHHLFENISLIERVAHNSLTLFRGVDCASSVSWSVMLVFTI
jgi:hypothetical protein